MKIPNKMGNDESKLVAAIVTIERELAIARASLTAAKKRYKNWKVN